MIRGGIKASELIKVLERLIEKHGDLQVFSGGTDYPEGVESVWYKERGNSYIPSNSFFI